jgi:hypothetical protein
MYYSAGPQYCYNLLYTVARKHFTRPAAELELEDFQRAYQSWLGTALPALPAPSQLGVELTNDEAREEQLVAPLFKTSALDDRDVYKDAKAYQNVKRDREQVAREVAHLADSLAKFREHDPGFWEVFNIFTNFIVCTDSKYTQGGTSSAALGVIYVVRPQDRTDDSLYELFVHESTHLMMFVDERRSRHYRNDALIAVKDNYVVSAVYERLRPLDKVLHSIVISTEVLLHRENVIGHDVESTIHPPTSKLVHSTLRSAEQTLELQARKQLLAPRGVQLVETCIGHLRELAKTAAAAPRVLAAAVA